jgi:hypothetical protein
MNFLATEDINQSDMPELPVDPDLGKWKFHRAIVENQKNYVKLQIGMLINGLNITRILIALVLVLLLNSFLYYPRAAQSFSKETLSIKALLLSQSKTSYYKVLLYEHSIYSYERKRVIQIVDKSDGKHVE